MPTEQPTGNASTPSQVASSNHATEGSSNSIRSDADVGEADSIYDYLEKLDQTLAGSPKSSDVVSEDDEDPSASKKKHRRKSRSNSSPPLNTWDVPEFMPGAQPGASAVEKALFEERSLKVFNNDLVMDKLDAEERHDREVAELGEKLEEDLSLLRQMFPETDLDILQESYLSLEGNLDATINQLLALSMTGDSVPARAPPPVSDDKAFPVLTDSEGWQVLGEPSSKP